MRRAESSELADVAILIEPLRICARRLWLTAAAPSLLLEALGVYTQIVYLGTVVALPAINFMVSRDGIFHPKRAEDEPTSMAVGQGPMVDAAFSI